MELAKAYFCQAARLNPNNIRALYGLLLVRKNILLKTYYNIKFFMSLNLQASNNIATSPKCPSSKKKDAIKLSEWAANQIEKQYQSKVTDESIKALEGLLGQLQLEIQVYKFIYICTCL